MGATLYYIHDPMCSWCWGYRSVWDALQENLPTSLRVEYVAGGLAPDSDNPMPIELQSTIQNHWRNIQNSLGTQFNFDFWTNNTPRRSTYMACRASIAADKQGCQVEMINAIQRAYYLRALNPSDSDVLIHLADELNTQQLTINIERFSSDLMSNETQRELERQILLARELTDQGFPSLVLESHGQRRSIAVDYMDYGVTLRDIAKRTHA
jgi:putative protein-disulfide isomerase